MEVVSLNKFDKHLSVICEQVSVLSCPGNGFVDSFHNFVLFHSVLSSSLFVMKKVYVIRLFRSFLDRKARGV